MLRLVIFVGALTALCHGQQKCTMQNGVRMYNGKRCASTTRYTDSNKGACGCGQQNSQFPWNHDHYVVAASQNLFDVSGGGKTWCGGSCGKCVKLTPTGGYIDGQGTAPQKMESITFMITNLCPPLAPNESWCAAKGTPGGDVTPNHYGYEVHFDLENGAKQADKNGWDNPEVTWEFAPCTGSNTPSPSSWHNCECSH